MSIESLIESGRRLVAGTLLDRAYVHDRTVVRTPGGATETWVRRPKPTPCRFGQLSDYEMAATAGTTFSAAQAAVSLPHDADVDEGDRLESMVDGTMWAVVGRLTPPSVMTTASRVLIREL